jgi:hypothetical protein
MKNTIFVLALLAASTCLAATKITFDEIPKHLGQSGILEHRGITVTTADGKNHKGKTPGSSLGSSEDLAWQDQ